MSANEELLDASIRHQVGLQRLSAGILRRIIGLLNAVDDDLVRIILKHDPTAVSGTFSRRRLEKLLKAVRDLNREAYAALTSDLDGELRDLAAYEAEWQQRLIRGALPVQVDIVKPSRGQLVAAVKARPFQGRFLREWYSGLEESAQRRLREAIRIGFVEGETIDQMIRRVRGTRAQQYRDGILEASRRDAQMVVRTAVNHTASVARNETYRENAGAIKGIRWVATLDSRTSMICASRDGKVYPLESGPRPPAHINCLPGDALVTSRYRVTGASKRWYDGQLVVIRTAAGKEVSCTPNHPILTDGGWIGANHLNVGDNVVCDGGAEWSAPALNVDHEHVPTTIEKVAEATFRSREMVAGPVPTTAEDFHGDGMDGEVAIVAANRFLADGADAPFAEHGGEAFFVDGDMRLPVFAGFGAFCHLFVGPRHAANGIVSGLCRLGAIFGRCARHARRLLLGPVSQAHAMGFEYACHGASGNIVTLGDTANSYATLKELDRFFERYVDPRLPSAGTARLAGFIKSTEDSVAADTKLATDILGGATGPVFLDKVVSVECRDFSGHVFNLETEKGFYVAGGIITHNCRSSTAPVLKSWKEMGIDLQEAPEGTRASLDGQVPASTTYSDWLRRQPPEVQDDVLGKAKGRLYRKGGLSVDRFVDRAGNELTLDQLRRREADAFEKAGID